MRSHRIAARVLVLVVAASVTVSSCREAAAPEGWSPPGVTTGAWLEDVRMIDPEPRLTAINGRVESVRGPWVLVATGDRDDAARYWVNFAHVCTYRVRP